MLDRGSGGPPDKRDGNEPVSEQFRLVFRTVVFLTVGSALLSLALNLLLVACPDASSEVRDVLHIAETIWQMGAGAIIGLLGGKTIK
jgi:hypothetical protein